MEPFFKFPDRGPEIIKSTDVSNWVSALTSCKGENVKIPAFNGKYDKKLSIFFYLFF
jgi:hypothetical protein